MELDNFMDVGDCGISVFIRFLDTRPGTVALYLAKVLGIFMDGFGIYQVYEERDSELGGTILESVILLIVLDRALVLLLLSVYGSSIPERYEEYVDAMVQAGKVPDGGGALRTLYRASMFSALDWMGRLYTANTFVIKIDDDNTIASSVPAPKITWMWVIPLYAECNREGGCLWNFYYIVTLYMEGVFVYLLFALLAQDDADGNVLLFASLTLQHAGILQNIVLVFYANARKTIYDRSQKTGCCRCNCLKNCCSKCCLRVVVIVLFAWFGATAYVMFNAIFLDTNVFDTTEPTSTAE